ncbi:unnamed protein product [Adineta steineri]|uniref:Uncharacterized protein n=2 Tax=Adineta steineri TaxID=433720 RepID=A0A813XSQ5_9BILA|nr:unnamed protein product [Adineta steineri]
MQIMNVMIVLLLSLFVNGQIPNPGQYRFTLTTNGVAQERYAVDAQVGKMLRIWFSNIGDEEFGGNQDIYVRADNRTYFFDFMSQPPQCIANRGGPYNEMNYWPKVVDAFGGESKTYDELIFDVDCDGTCLTWTIEFNSTLHYHYHYQDRLYVKKSERKPIKSVLKAYDIDTGKLVSTDVTRFIGWNTDKIPEYEFDYPMDLKTCYYA